MLLYYFKAIISSILRPKPSFFLSNTPAAGVFGLDLGFIFILMSS